MTIEKIYQSTLRLLVPLTPEEAYVTIIEEANKLIGASYGSVFLAEDNELKRVYSSVPKNQQMSPRPGGNTYQVFREGKPLILTIDELKKFHTKIKETKTQFIVFIPLAFDNKAIGVLTLHSHNHKIFPKAKLDNLQLFGSLATLTIRNVQLLTETQEAVRQRERFISMASHELKTPMTTVSGYTQLLERMVTQNKPINRDWVAAMRKETKRLSRLIGELLEVNQIQSGISTYQFRMSSLKNAIKQAIDDIGFTHPRHHIVFEDLSQETDIFLNMDPEKIIQVLINVLNNAAKFSSPEYPIHLTLNKVKKNICVEIEDQGEGISPRDLPRVFEESYRGFDTKKEGVGLGLYIVKKVVENHHGKIKIISQLGKGTKVSLYFPLNS